MSFPRTLHRLILASISHDQFQPLSSHQVGTQRDERAAKAFRTRSSQSQPPTTLLPWWTNSFPQKVWWHLPWQRPLLGKSMRLLSSHQVGTQRDERAAEAFFPITITNDSYFLPEASLLPRSQTTSWKLAYLNTSSLPL
ncbi:hypothetical protein SLA2020_506590 [Shorea laevis]